jgi:hypothetical protein
MTDFSGSKSVALLVNWKENSSTIPHTHLIIFVFSFTMEFDQLGLKISPFAPFSIAEKVV